MARGEMGLSLESLGVQQPYSMTAEQSVLGAAILDQSAVDLIMQNLRAEMFFVRQNRAVFTEIQSLVETSQPVDVVLLAERLSFDSLFESSSAARNYLAELADTVPSLSNLPYYLNLVRDKYIKRQLMDEARNILEQAADDVDSQMMLESAEQRLYDIQEGRDTSEVQQLKFAIIDIMSHLQNLSGPNRKDYLGISTGYGYLDKKLTGMGRSDLIILAARPGMGKTSFALNIATNVAEQNLPVVVFSLEMTKEQLAGRILSAKAMVDSKIFRSGVEKDGDWEDLTRMTELMGNLPLFLDDTSMITIPEMKSKIRQINRTARAAGRKKVGLVVIDYLQLMSSGHRSENRVQELSAITRNLKIMAKDLDVPVMALSQLSRSTEKGRADHRPMLSDLRDSGSIEQDADVVMFLYRDAYYDDGPDADMGSAQVIIAKNRHGETANVDMMWDGAHTRFIEVDHKYQQ